MREDTEFYNQDDEYATSTHNNEFPKNNSEFFNDHQSIEPQRIEKHDNNRVRRIAPVVISAACIVIVMVNVQMSVSSASNIVHTPTVETVPSIESSQVIGTEYTIEMTETTAIEEETPSLSETQKMFINKVWEAFENDDPDTLETLLHDSALDELCKDTFKRKVFIQSNDVLVENRSDFSGKGLLLSKYDNDNIQMTCVNFVNGVVSGYGKKITINITDFDDQTVISREYYSGNWDQNKAYGEGTLQCRHEVWFHSEEENSHRIQSDIGKGFFNDGFLIDGSGVVNWTEDGTADWNNGEYYSKEVTCTYEYVNGIIESGTNQSIDLVSGEEHTGTSDIGAKQDHFVINRISD